MSRLEWLLLFLVFVVYVVLGGVVLMHFEGQQEQAQRALDLQHTRQLQDLVQSSLLDGSDERLQTLARVAEYCGKPLLPDDSTLNATSADFTWDFYNSFFVAVTIVSTIGYGNMAPTTFGTRMFCIGYALVGIPLNGILLAGLGEYFSRTFLRAHHRYKEAPQGRCQMLLKVMQYLAAGLALFILLPGVIFALAEGWSYEEAVYYAFVTLATIGFGDYVAGYMTKEKEWKHEYGLLGAYRAFIVLWIMFGLGYLAMILSFITRAMRSSRLRRLEQKLARRIKSTRLWQAGEIGYLRRVLNELYLLKFKPVYRARRSLAAPGGAASRGRSRSLSLPEPQQAAMPRSLSEACLDLIDRDATFAAAPRRVDAADLLATVVAAAASAEERDAGAHHGLPDDDILADEAPPPASRRGSFFASLSRKSSVAPQPPPSSRRSSLLPAALSRRTSPAASRRGSLVNGDARRQRGREASLRRVVAERNLNAASQQSSPNQGRRSTLGGWDPMARRRSDGVVSRRPSDEIFSELDDTTVGDLLRALHSLHSRRGSLLSLAPPTLTVEDETRAPPQRPDDDDDDWDGKSVQISHL